MVEAVTDNQIIVSVYLETNTQYYFKYMVGDEEMTTPIIRTSSKGVIRDKLIGMIGQDHMQYQLFYKTSENNKFESTEEIDVDF